jgi:hypothetical protein
MSDDELVICVNSVIKRLEVDGYSDACETSFSDAPEYWFKYLRVALTRVKNCLLWVRYGRESVPLKDYCDVYPELRASILASADADDMYERALAYVLMGWEPDIDAA